MSTVTVQDALDDLERRLAGARAPISIPVRPGDSMFAQDDDSEEDLFGEDDLGFDDIDEEDDDELDEDLDVDDDDEDVDDE